MKTLHIVTPETYKTGEQLEFLNYVLNVFKDVDVVSLQLKKRVDDLTQAAAELEAGFQNPVGMDYTKDVKTADKERMQTMSAFSMCVRAMAKRRNPEQVAMANLLLKYIKLHCHRISHFSLPQKTAKIKALLKDIHSSPALTHAVQKLHLSDEIVELEKANNALSDIHLKNARSKKAPSTTKEKRADSKSCFNLLMRDTLSHANLSETNTTYQFLIEEVNKITHRYNVPLKLKRKMRRNAAKVFPTPIPQNIIENQKRE